MTLRRAASTLLFTLLTAASLPGQQFEVYRQFPWSQGPVQEKLALGSDGNLYGTAWGGEFGRGRIFRLVPDGNGGWSYELLYSFHGPDGVAPSGVVFGADGRLYGASWYGGELGGGTVFAFDLVSGGLVVLHAFPQHSFYGPYLPSRLLAASDGNLYGATQVGGASGFGILYRVTTSNQFATIHEFTGPDGERPNALMQASDGFLYGTTTFGGAGVGGAPDGNGLSGGGTIFRADLSGAVTVLHTFPGTNNYPNGDLLETSDGNLYGTTFNSGASGTGSIFRSDKQGNTTVLHSFPSAAGEGAYLNGGLTLAPDGNFYGVTGGGGAAQSGTLYRMASDGTVTTPISFPGPYPTGVGLATSGLTLLSDGSLVGTTTWGGTTANPAGVVFRVPLPATTADVLYELGGPFDVAYPASELVQTPDGTLWGTGTGGGAAGLGTVFRLSGGPLVAHEFSGSDGANPGDLFAAPDGTVYGVTPTQGAGGAGTIFSIDGTGAFTTLHAFSGGDGSEPAGGLMQASDGNLYGTTAFGGANGGGTLFRITSSGTHTKLHDFQANAIPEEPRGRILQASDGMLYFTGFGFRGWLFKSDLDGNVTDIHDFFNTDGEKPPAGVIQADDGNLYGTTRYFGGGPVSLGTVFRFDLPSTFAVVHDFTDEGRTLGTVVQGGDGRLYGTTTGELVGGNGGVFGMDLSGANFSMIRELSYADGVSPAAGLTRASDGMLYGTTQGGGASGLGVVYRLDLTDAPPSIGDIEPASGLAAGGVPITIHGDHLRPGVVATFGQTPSTSQEAFESARHFAVSPPLTPGTLYDVTVTNTDAQSATLPLAFFADFLDASGSSAFHDAIEAIFRSGITAGCGGGGYCTSASVTRGQMAVFLLKAEHGAAYTPPGCTGVFTDVPCPSMFADWIEQLAGEAITGGCGGGNYCPNDPVARDQMSVLMLRTEHGTGYAPPACAGVFSDVPCPSMFADWIEQLALEGITAGCGGTRYCPDSSTTRGQMAVFLEKMFLGV